MKRSKQEQAWVREDATLAKQDLAMRAAKAAYYAFPAEYRDECCDRENAAEYAENTATFWEIMFNSALARKECN
jgi:hypothetical protein